MKRFVRTAFTALMLLLWLAWAAAANSDARKVDGPHSTLTVRVYKSGFLSAFGHNHEIQAPIQSGEVKESGSPRVRWIGPTGYLIDNAALSSRSLKLGATRTNQTVSHARAVSSKLAANLNAQYGCSALLEVPSLTIAQCGPYAEGHETERRQQENHHPFADCPLPILGRRLCRAVAHGTCLAKGRRGP